MDSNGYQGYNWFQNSQPSIFLYDNVDNSKDVVYCFYGADRFVEFKRFAASGNTFKGTNGAAGVILFVADGGGPDTYVLTDQHGNELTFFGFDGACGDAAGQLWKIRDASANTAYVGHATSAATAISSGYSSGRITTAYDPGGRRYTYTYSTLDGAVRLTQVKAEQNTGSWVMVAQVDYGYYTNEAHGDAGDLEQVTITTPLSDSGVTLVKKKYYRYYEGDYEAEDGERGYPHALKYIVDFEGVRRFDWQDQTFDNDHWAATDASLEPYALVHFEYEEDDSDAPRRITRAWFNGECGCSGGNNGTFEFKYEDNGSFSDTPNSYDPGWAFRTVVKRPDLSYMTQYWDETGQPLSQVITNGDPDDTSPAPSRWATKVTRNSTGSVERIATPANCTTYAHSTGAISSSSSVGLVWEFSRETGAMLGYLGARRFKEGVNGNTPYYAVEYEYDQKDLTIDDGNDGETEVIRPVLKKIHHYQVQGTSTGNRITTDYAPTWHTGTLSLERDHWEQPAIDDTRNGSDSRLGGDRYHRVDGTLSFEKSRDGVLTYYGYEGGVLAKVIEDADTGETGDFDAIPGGLTSSGGEFHHETSFAYDAQGRVDVVTGPDGQKTKHYYTKLADGRVVELVYADYETTPSTKFYGPVSYTVANQAGNVEAQATVALTSNESTTALTSQVDETDADPITAMDLGTVVRLSTQIHNESGHTIEESRFYFDVPASGAGTDGTNYDPTLFGYDDSGRRIRTKASHGTITRTVYDDIGRVESRWTGTNDDLEGGTDDMVQVELVEYDGGADDGNSYVTERTLFVQDNSTGQRVTSYAHDARGRVLLQTNPTAPHALYRYDNEGRVLATGLYSSTGSITVGTSDPSALEDDRLALTENEYDEVGQLWKSVRYNIDAGDGTEDDTLEHLYWRDAEGRVLKEDGPQLFKVTFDRLGRETHRFVLAKDNDSTYAHADDVTGDHVLEEHQTVYDADNDDVLMTVSIDRKHSSWNLFPVPTGPLDSNADGYRTVVTDANLAGRQQITAMWYDRFGRTTDVVQYGDNGASNFDRNPGVLSVPSRSDTELVTSYAYETGGTLLTVTDPRGLVKKTVYDEGGRLVTEIRNYNSGVNSGNPANPDDNQTVRYAFVDGLRTSITADMPSGETDQVTTYIYGTTKGTPGASKVGSGHLLRAVVYPDSTNAGTTNSAINSDSSDVVSHAYNAQGQVVYQKDQAGNVFELEFDDSGRELHKRVTTLAGGFDGAVRRVSRTYDSLGRPSLVTQYDASSSGNVTDEVAYAYDGWGGVTSFKQDPDSAIGGSGFYEMAYAYAKNMTGRNTVRRSSMTLPGSKTITLDYTADFDGYISRVSRLKDGATTLARYEYLGQSRVVGTVYAQPGISSKQFGSGDSFTGYLDRFNRILESRWTTDLSPAQNFYEVDLTYDRNSNIAWAEDRVHTGFDVKYTMDDLDRLIDADEGTRNSGSIASRTRHQTWMHGGASQLDHLGNWTRSKLDLNDVTEDWSDDDEYDEIRTHTEANEIETQDVDASGAPPDHTLVYDAVGNLIDDDATHTYVYDAFSRLRQILDEDGAPVQAEYRYNGLGFMIGVREDTDADGDSDSSDKWFYPVYDEAWREVARYREDDSSPKEQFVNAMAGLDGYGGSSYINDVVCRNKDANTSWTSASDGTLEQRFFYCPNWRGDVSAMVSSGRILYEWGKYSPYGVPNGRPGADTNSDGTRDSSDVAQIQAWIDTPHYDVRADVDLDGEVDVADKVAAQQVIPVTLGWRGLSDDAVANRRGLAGYEYSQVNVHAHIRHRAYRAGMGYWLQREPMKYAAGMNFYAHSASNPLRYNDQDGLAPGEANYGHWNDKPRGEVPSVYPVAPGTQPSRAKKIEATAAARSWANEKGLSSGRGYYGRDGGAENAMKHCIWSCLLCISEGPSVARATTDDHETSAPANTNKKTGEHHADPDDPATWTNGSDMGMDLWNNAQGIMCCQNMMAGTGSCEKCCARKAADRGLLWLNRTPLVYKPPQGGIVPEGQGDPEHITPKTGQPESRTKEGRGFLGDPDDPPR